jgi:hypothetical protein
MLRVALIGTHSTDYGRIREWRDSYIGDNPASESFFDWRERLRDEASYQFAFYRERSLAGGVRFIPVGHGLTLSERLADVQRSLGTDRRMLEVSRLLLDEACRGGTLAIDALRCCFDWIGEHTVHDELIALCLPRFFPLYARLGARIARENINGSPASGKRYCLIHMNIRSNA